MLLLIVFVLGLSLLPMAMILFWQNDLSNWRWWEFVLLLLPFVIWLSLSTFGGRPKSLSNAVIESLLCGIAAILPIVVKLVAIRFRWESRPIFGLGLVISCTLVLMMYFTVPVLPE